MLLIALVCSLCVAATAQAENDWIDPYDMLNYDASTKSMRKPAEPANYDNVPTKRREYNRDSNQVEVTPCGTQVAELQRQNEELKKKITLISQPSTCSPLFKRFLTRLQKEIERVGLPSDSTEVLYDAKIQLSKQAMTEIQSLLNGEESFTTGALDKILVDLRPHDYEAWKWRFEDTFGVELDTVLKLGLGVLVLVAIICTQLWSKVSWFVQFGRLFGVSFFVSIIWNWIYLYKIAFAEHQRKLAKMNDSEYEKCIGVRKIDWSDSLKEWLRSTWTLQDDPCKKYYDVDPWLLVPPTKALAVTITTFITEPLEHIGEGISKFLRALLKDLPVTLQIPVLITIVLAIVVCMYGGVQAAFQHGIAAPFRRPRRDPPPPQLEQWQPHLQQIEDGDHLAGGDGPQHAPRHRADDARLHRNQVHRRRPNRPREEPAKVVVETLRNAEPNYSENETDAAPPHEEEQNLSAESDSENQQETQDEVEGASAGSVPANATQTETKPTESEVSPSKTKPPKVNKKLFKGELSRDDTAPRSLPAEGRPSLTEVQLCTRTNGMVNIHVRHKLNLQASAEDRTSSDSLLPVETVGVPVQETSPTPAD
uniref:chloride channel CLIC-like protein 1 isoform X1 n=1 Tax=Epinephelus lanceolatus TaxID=310571 RepID=UPI001445D14A|nr:chloride channel CLIC-like protein 1 isoform X1 [Epinephelus lanceolatus]